MLIGINTNKMENKKSNYFERVAAFMAAIILIQTLYFKFTSHPDSVYIFMQIGGEPHLRIGSGVIELIIVLLLLYQKTALWGAILGLAVMSGAIGQHLLVLGIVVNNDGGVLFTLAIITFICCLIILYLKRSEVTNLIKKIQS
jgi:putative oxidoreductase